MTSRDSPGCELLSDNDSCGHRYRGVGVFVDSSTSAAAMTPLDFQINTPGEVFDMTDHSTGESWTGTTFKLDWTYNDSTDRLFVQLKFIEINYTFRGDANFNISS